MLVHFGAILVKFPSIWYILWPFGIFCAHLVYFDFIWSIFPPFGMFYLEKSGNPDPLRGGNTSR
jgi:hypothetical protein